MVLARYSAVARRPTAPIGGGCTALVHASCALEASLTLTSCAHFGGELYFFVCAEHTANPMTQRPEAPVPSLPLTAPKQQQPAAAAASSSEAEPSKAAASDAQTGERVYLHQSESRQTKVSKLMKLAQAPDGITNTVAQLAAQGAAASGGDWWWALRVDLVPPLLEPSACGLGSIRLGADGRRWKVVAAGGIDGKAIDGDAALALDLLWAPLHSDGELAKPSQLPPPSGPTRASGLPDRLTGRARPTLDGLGGRRRSEDGGWLGGGDEEDDDGGYGGGGGYSGGSGGPPVGGDPIEARYAGGQWIGDRYELPASATDGKMWPGAYSEGWKVRESYKGSRTVGTWCYIHPNGTKYRTKVEAYRAAGVELPDGYASHHMWAASNGGVGRGRGRGGGGGSGGRGRGKRPSGGGGDEEWSHPKVRLVMSRGGAPSAALMPCEMGAQSGWAAEMNGLSMKAPRDLGDVAAPGSSNAN